MSVGDMTPGVPHPCCVPSNDRLTRLAASIQLSHHRARATRGSLENMVRLDGGCFRMGSEAVEAIPADGEGPVRQVTVSPCYICAYAVTHRRFAEFVPAASYLTETERL